jgi:hypothetical protein
MCNPQAAAGDDTFPVIGDVHKIITFYLSIIFNFSALAIFSPRFVEILTAGCEIPECQATSVAV